MLFRTSGATPRSYVFPPKNNYVFQEEATHLATSFFLCLPRHGDALRAKPEGHHAWTNSHARTTVLAFKRQGLPTRSAGPTRTMVPRREPPYQTRPLGTTPTSAAGFRRWSTHSPRTSVPATPPSGDPFQITPEGLSGVARRARTNYGGEPQGKSLSPSPVGLG